jgi:hypothetical protein
VEKPSIYLFIRSIAMSHFFFLLTHSCMCSLSVWCYVLIWKFWFCRTNLMISEWLTFNTKKLVAQSHYSHIKHFYCSESDLYLGAFDLFCTFLLLKNYRTFPISYETWGVGWSYWPEGLTEVASLATLLPSHPWSQGACAAHCSKESSRSLHLLPSWTSPTRVLRRRKKKINHEVQSEELTWKRVREHGIRVMAK